MTSYYCLFFSYICIFCLYMYLKKHFCDQNDPENKLVKALITCEEATSVTSNWRLHADFLSCLSCLPFCISSETIFTAFVPLLFVKLHTAVSLSEFSLFDFCFLA